MPDFSAAIALLKKPIEDLYNATTGLIQEKLGVLKVASKVTSLHKKLWETQRVKTIWHTDRPLSLNSFFFPVTVTSSDGVQSSKMRLASLDDLPDNHNIIFGTVGQGKSILLRYLLGKEIKSGARIPVFCELRNLANRSLEEYLIDRFSLLLGVQSDTQIFETFAHAGKLTLLLDGFDEIDPNNVQRVLTEIEDLSYRLPTCRIVLTSRPDSECRHLTSFNANKINPLGESDLEPFYKRITRDDEFTRRLVAAIRSSPLKIQQLVTTPLLATLLAISYRAAQKIPLDFADFYEELFQILLVRHDGSKLGWQRTRKTKLNDREIQQIFEAFCFATRKRQKTTFDNEAAYQIAKETISECNIQTDAQHFLEDIRKITCLLVDESKKISFVHASVQEFFASRYIKTRPEPVAAKFYEQLSQGKWQSWPEELLFLIQIDNHRATKYFLIPDLNKTVKDLLGDEKSVNEEVVARYLSGIQVNRSVTTRDGKQSQSFYVKRNRAIHTHHYAILDSRAYSLLFSQDAEGARTWRAGFDAHPTATVRTYLEIAGDKGGKTLDQLRTSITNTINSFINDRKAFRHSIQHNESPRSFMDLG